MTLTPDEIAKRGFTPSADGYHQGEVREFLARIAAQHRAMHASLPEGGPQVTELMLAVSNHESRLHQLEARLHTALEQLEEATRSLQTTQDRASQQLATARKVTNDQRTMLEQLAPAASSPASAAPAAASLAAAQGAPAPAIASPAAPASPKPAAPAPQPEPARIAPAAAASSPTAPLTKPPVDRRPDRPTMAPPTPVPTTPPAPTPPRTSAPDVPNRAAAHVTAPAATPTQRSAGGSLPDGVVGQRVLRTEPAGSAGTSTPNAQRAAADEAASVAPPAVPAEELPQPSVPVTSIAPSTATPAPAPAPLPSPEAVLADFDRKPLIADNANDLLDGVLDDVMGTITERPDA